MKNKFKNGDTIRMEVTKETKEFITEPILFSVVGYENIIVNNKVIHKDSGNGKYIKAIHLSPIGDNKIGDSNFFPKKYMFKNCTLVENS